MTDKIYDIGWSVVYADAENDKDVDYRAFFKEVFNSERVRDEGHDSGGELIGTLFIDAAEADAFTRLMRVNGMEFCSSDRLYGSEYFGRFVFDGIEFILTFWDVPNELAEAV